MSGARGNIGIKTRPSGMATAGAPDSCGREPAAKLSGDYRLNTGNLLADYAVTVAIAHEGIGGVCEKHWSDAVAPCFGAGNPAVAVIVPEEERIDIAR